MEIPVAGILSSRLPMSSANQTSTRRQRFFVSNDWPRIDSPSIWRALILPKILYFSARGEGSFSPFAQKMSRQFCRSLSSRGFLDSALLRSNTDS
jgi:hypothetical protein